MRLPRPFSFIRTLTVGFGITPNLLTLPFQQIPGEEGARGLGLLHPYRRWGLSPRPENISHPVLSDLKGIMAITRSVGKNLRHRNFHVCVAGLTAQGSLIRLAMRESAATGLAIRESDSGLFSSETLTRAKSCGRAAHCLWMDSPCRCADSANHIT
jgi:hypothetical protein